MKVHWAFAPCENPNTLLAYLYLGRVKWWSCEVLIFDLVVFLYPYKIKGPKLVLDGDIYIQE